jgi:hypothetical protein
VVFHFRLGSTPVIENSEPNFRKGWKADTSRLNDTSAPIADIQAAFPGPGSAISEASYGSMIGYASR